MIKLNKYALPVSYAFVLSFWPCTIIYCLINSIIRELSFNDFKITWLLLILDLFPYYVLFISLSSFLYHFIYKKGVSTTKERVFHIIGYLLAVILFVLTIIPDTARNSIKVFAFLIVLCEIIVLYWIFKGLLLKNKADLSSIWAFISVFKRLSFWISLLIITIIITLIIIACICFKIPFLIVFGIMCLVLGIIIHFAQKRT